MTDTQARPWLDEMYSFIARHELEDAADLMFDRIDDLLLDGEFSEVDDILRSIDLARLESFTMIALLSITLAPKGLLSHRSAVVVGIEEFFVRTDPTRIESLMSGLR